MTVLAEYPRPVSQPSGAFNFSRYNAAKNTAPSKQMLFDILAIYDVACILISGAISHYVYLNLFLGVSVPVESYALTLLIAAIIFHTFARQTGQYKSVSIQSFMTQISSLIYICATTIASTFVVLFFMKAPAQISRIWLLLWTASLLLLLAGGRAVLSHYLEFALRKGALRRSVALIGSGPQFASVKKTLQQDGQHFNLVSSLELGENLDAASSKAVCLDSLQSIIDAAQTSAVDEVIVALPSSEGKRLERIVQQVQMLPVDVHVLPDFGGANIAMRKVEYINDLCLITTVSKPISGWGAYAKAIEDYLIASVCLILALPAMALIALAIKIDSKGPVFFRQRRHGYNHRVIEVLKFRTMTVLEDGDAVKQATKHDDRITKVGAFLRRTSLDELPQLWNVIRGEMSVVGPRPHALAHNSYYGGLVENYANRHRVKPGMTGWAQVHGFRGETGNPELMEKRVLYDLEYIESWSIGLDLKIILMTPLFGLFRRSAY